MLRASRGELAGFNGMPSGGLAGLIWRGLGHAARACKVFRVRFFDLPMKPATSAASRMVCRSRSQDQRKALKKIDPNNLTEPYKGYGFWVDR
jgi:hypothetical protein